MPDTSPQAEVTVNRVAVVTGGAGELGAAIATHLVRDGATVVLADLKGERASRRASEIAEMTGGSIVGWQLDVSSDAQNRALVERLAETYGRIDQLINNAALAQTSPNGQVGDNEWNAVMGVNVWGPASLCQATVPLWRATGGGQIVNVVSRTWRTGGPIAYVSSKAALVGLTRALAVEFGPLGVTVNAVAPSMVDTPFATGQRTEEEQSRFRSRHLEMSLLRRLATPTDVAEAVGFLASPRAAFITGEVLHVSGGAQLAPPP